MNCFKLAIFISFASRATTCSAWLSDPKKGSLLVPTRRISSGSNTFLSARKQKKRPRSVNKPSVDSEDFTDSARIISSSETSTKTPNNKPLTTKKVQIFIPRVASSSTSTPSNTTQYPLSIQVYQVKDALWWEDDSNDNRYGGRCWPSSMAVAQFLVNHIGDCQNSDRHRRSILELACGPGIPALVAASCGAQVIATDVSPVALGLLTDGRRATSKKLLRKQDESSSSSPSSAIYNTWVIVGDDDTGERDEGRKVFLDELQRLEQDLPAPIPRVWMHSKVQNDNLGWRDKTAHLLHLNPPSSLLESIADSEPE